MRAGGLRWLFILLAILLNGLPLLTALNRSKAVRADFVLPPKTPPGTNAPSFTEENINPISSNAMVHVASICELPDGTLAASWYGGSREGAPDVAIFFATRAPHDAAWSAPRAMLTPQIAARELHRAVRKVGNSLLFCDGSGKLWLLYVTITVGGWSDSSLNLTTSSDRGQTWTPSERLTLSPFFNISELVKNGPTPLSNGGWAVPIYHELIGKFAEVLCLNDSAGGDLAVKTRVLGGRSGFQPSMVALSTNNALMFLRDLTANRRIAITRSADVGEHWSAPELLDLPNPDSGLDGLRLPDGRLLLAFNDSKHGRANLRLGLSTDNGKSWQRIATLAEEAKAEFSYPFLLQTRDGNIHAVYTWKRKAVKHVVFNEAWVNAQVANGGVAK